MGLLSLGKRRPRGDLSNAYRYQKGRAGGQGQALISTRGSGHKAALVKLHTNTTKHVPSNHFPSSSRRSAALSPLRLWMRSASSLCLWGARSSSSSRRAASTTASVRLHRAARNRSTSPQPAHGAAFSSPRRRARRAPRSALTARPALPGPQQHQLRLRRQRAEERLAQLRPVLVEAQPAACQRELPGRSHGTETHGKQDPQPLTPGPHLQQPAALPQQPAQAPGRRPEFLRAAGAAKVGERLGRYEVEKRCAVEKEDYDLAKKKKQQMDAYRMKVYQQLQLHNLLDAELLARKPADLPVEPGPYDDRPQCTKATNSPSSESTDLRSSQGELWKAESLLEEKPAEPASPQPAFLHQSTPPTLSHPTTSRAAFAQQEVEFLPYDERPLPAIQKHPEEAIRYLEPEKTEGDSTHPARSGIAGEPEALSEKALREASPAIEVFGEALVSGAYSKSWSYREDALLAVYKKLVGTAVSTPKEDVKSMLRAAIFLVRRAIKDIVSSVFQASLKLLKMLLTQYVPKHKLGKLETSHCVEKTLPGLLSRTGDSSARLRIAAAKFIQEMALWSEVKPLQIVPVHLVQPLKPNSPTHLAMSRVELVECLLKEMGTENSGFTISNAMKFATGALEHRVYEVRDAALRIIFDMYRKHQAAILEYLPPDDASIRKTVLYKTLFDGFTKIDGKLSEAEVRAQKKAATEEAERQKKEEIKVLQGQLAALREIQAEVQAGKERESDFQKTKDEGYKSPQPAAAEIPDDHSSVANYLDNLCIFCGERNESFTEEGLDLHYWKRCPMLTRCEHCKQVVEIASLTEHLLTECDQKDSFGKCQRCREAFPKDELPKHIKSKTCNAAKPEEVANHCPLCHDNFSPGEEAWKSHLMGTDGCAMNLRRLSTINKTIPMQPGKTGGHYLKKPSPSRTKVRPPSIGSKIPAPRGGPNKSSGKTYSKQ
uniref:Centrosomal protein of 104 kDa n=1 Tax=Pavo cristatus TaxID=9049 RepID=A0A8C9EWM6_PAVCR